MKASLLPSFRHGPNSTKRVPFTRWMSTDSKNHFVAALGEFVGTSLFLFFAFGGTQIANTNDVTLGTTSTDNSRPDTSALLFIAASFGASLTVNAWVFFRVSGGLFNPAVTLGMVLVRAITVARGACIFVAQILGGIVASAIVDALTPGAITFQTTVSVSVVRGLFIEMFCTSMLVFTIFMLATEKHRSTFIAPVGIGLALFIAEIAGVCYTGGAVNPARAFGPAVAAREFVSYHWIYWVGPGLGALLASAFYKLIKILEYETANPGSEGGPEVLREVRCGSGGRLGMLGGGGSGSGPTPLAMADRANEGGVS